MIYHQIILGDSNLADSYKVRQDVFIKEQGFKIDADEIDKLARHVVIYDDNMPIATGRVFSKEGGKSEYILGRIAVVKEYRGKNIGAMIIKCLEDEIKKLGGKAAELSSQVTAKGFYEKLGYVTFGEQYLDEHCSHIGMRKVIG